MFFTDQQPLNSDNTSSPKSSGSKPSKNPDPLDGFKKVEFQFKITPKKILIWGVVIFVMLSLLYSYINPPFLGREIALSQVIADIKQAKIKQIEIEDNRLNITYNDDSQAVALKEPGQSLTEIFSQSKIDPTSVDLKVKDSSGVKLITEIIGTLLPIGLMALFFFMIIRQARGAQNSLFSFGRSRAKLFAKGKQDIKFSDVGGVEEAKKELEEIVDFLKNPKKYQAVGARTPKGALLVGPSGTGKTLLARAVAGEANVPFFSMAGSEFMEMLVGVGASRVRDLFSTAKKRSPSIIFIDEIDAIGRMRGLGAAGGHDEREQTLNQILVEMDGFAPNESVIVLAATNRGDLLDPALMRPGRFDRRVQLDLPDKEGRLKIIDIHKKGKPFEDSISWDKVASRTVGFSGADLENMLNESAILAARNNRKQIIWDDIEEAATKVKLGPEKKRLQTKEERLMTAYHEAGHAVVAWAMPSSDPVHRISIVSRGMALGFTLIPPERDKYNDTRTELLEKVASLLGGRAAEELVFNELTGGAASDIDQATRIIRRMVINYGMSRLGPIYLGPQFDKSDWGKLFIKPNEASNEMQAAVDKEIKRLIDEAYQKSLAVLAKYRHKLDQTAQLLVKQETIEKEEFEALMGPRPKRQKQS